MMPRPALGQLGAFFAAAEAMRRILIDRAREKRSAKRGGGRQKLDIDAIAGEARRDLRDVELRSPRVVEDQGEIPISGRLRAGHVRVGGATRRATL